MPEQLEKLLSKKLLDNTFQVLVEHEFAKMPEKNGIGWNVFACEHIVIPSKQWADINTGIHIIVPDGWELLMRSHTKLAKTKGVSILNNAGTISRDYRNPLSVLLYNAGEYPFDIHPRDVIAWISMLPIFMIQLEEISALPDESQIQTDIYDTKE